MPKNLLEKAASAAFRALMPTGLSVAILVGLCRPALVVAAEAAAPSQSSGYTFVSILMLMLMAAAVAVLAWLMRRGALGGQRTGNSMRVIAAQTLGARERVVVITVGGRYFLLGHTAHHVSMLAELQPDDVPQAAARLPENLFADLLGKLKK